MTFRTELLAYFVALTYVTIVLTFLATMWHEWFLFRCVCSHFYSLAWLPQILMLALIIWVMMGKLQPLCVHSRLSTFAHKRSWPI